MYFLGTLGWCVSLLASQCQWFKMTGAALLFTTAHDLGFGCACTSLPERRNVFFFWFSVRNEGILLFTYRCCFCLILFPCLGSLQAYQAPFCTHGQSSCLFCCPKQVVTSLLLLSAGDSGHPDQPGNQRPSALLRDHRHSHQTGTSSNWERKITFL